MAFEKYTGSEGKLQVLQGRSAQVLNDHFRKNGKYQVSEFDDQQKKALELDLAAAVAEDERESVVEDVKAAENEGMVDPEAAE